MDLSHPLPTKLSRLFKKSFSLTAIIALSACNASPAKQASNSVTGPVVTPTEVAQTKDSAEPVETLPLTAELTYLILTAEIAQQRGDVVDAADLYSRAAHLLESPALANRATQLANLTRDQHRINKALERWVEVDPDNADIYMLQTPFFMLQGNYNGAVTAANKALALAPERSALYLSRTADNLSKIVPKNEALTIMEQLVPYQQGNIEALYQYARLANYFQQYERALTTLNAIIEQEPTNNNVLILKAKVLQSLNRPQQALAVLKEPASKTDSSKSIRFAYAKLLGENNKIAESRRHFNVLAEEFPEDQEIIFASGLLALEQGDLEQAKSYFHLLLSLGDNGKQAAYFIGLTEKQAEHIDKALVWFASVPADSSRFEAAQTHYVDLLAQTDQLGKARQHIQSLRITHPQKAVQYYLFEATFLREQGLKQAAYDVLNQALEEYPQQIDLLYGRAMVAEQLNRLDILEDDLRKILKLEPDNTQALNALGYTLTDRTDRHQEALLLINKALELKPNDPFYLDSLGWVYYRLGKLELAAHYLRQAISLQNDVEFSAHLGEVLWQQGHHEQAKEVWEQALELDSNNQLLRSTMKRFGL